MARLPDHASLALGRRRYARAMADAGWGVKCQWPVRRADGSELVFSVRVPTGTRIVDVAAMADAGDGVGAMPPAARAGADALRESIATPGPVICAGAVVVDEDPRTVWATLTVGLAEQVQGLPGPAALDGLAARTRGRELRRDVRRPSDRAIVLDRLSDERAAPDDEPLAMLLVQYLLSTRYGLLSMAFATTRVALIGERGRGLFAEIADSGWLGEIEGLY